MSVPGGTQNKPSENAPDKPQKEAPRRVIVAKSAGFCFGVKRAVDTVYRLSEGAGVYSRADYS